MADEKPTLTDAEIVRLKKIAREDERMEWLWANVRRIASWITIVIGALALFWDQVRKFVGWLAKAVGG